MSSSHQSWGENLCLAVIVASLGLVMTSAQAANVTNVTLTFHDRGTALPAQTLPFTLQGGTYPTSGGVFTPNGSGAFLIPFGNNKNGDASEFRMIAPYNAVGGGGLKSVVGRRDNGTGSNADTFQWVFNPTLTNSGLIRTDRAPPAPNDGLPTGSPAPAAPAPPVPGIETNAIFFGSKFGFLIPPGGAGQVSVDLVNQTMTVTFPKGLNAHWADFFFPLGFPNSANQCNSDGQGCGIRLSGPIKNVVVGGCGAGCTSFDFELIGEHRITPWEDTEGATVADAGFTAWRPQWDMQGTGQVTGLAVLWPPFVDNGTIEATPGGPAAGGTYNRGRLSLAKLEAVFPVDTGVTKPCVGSCFDFTVTAMTKPSVQVVLPLSAPIPIDPVYRKFINGKWTNFDTSGGDTVESAPGLQGNCKGVTSYTPGLTTGNFCVRLTIRDGGPNDADGATNHQVKDPGGVAQGKVLVTGTQRPGQSLGGCSISRVPAGPTSAVDWWLIGAVLGTVGVARRRRRAACQRRG